LWVNGKMVAETSVPSGYAESKFSFVYDDFYIGNGGSGTDSYAADGYSCYAYVLTEEQINNHFQACRDVVKMDDNVGFYGGAYRDGTQRNIFQQFTYTSTADWLTGENNNVSVADDSLRPTESQEVATLGLSFAGSWIGKYSLDTTELATIAGVKAEWNGDGNFIVESSLDGGSTYQTVTNGELIPTSQGLNPAGKNLLIRVSFTGGVLNDIATVRDLTLTAYRDNYIYGNDVSRPMLITGNVSTAIERNEPIESNERAGIHFYSGFVKIAADNTESPINTQTYEFWVKPRGVTSGSGGYIFDNRGYGGTTYLWIVEATGAWGFANATVYVNGSSIAGGTVLRKNEWYHVVIVLPAANNLDANIGTGQFLGEMNMVATYPTALSAAQVLALYNGYQTQPTASITEVGVPVIFEPANPFVLTSLDWATLPQQ